MGERKYPLRTWLGLGGVALLSLYSVINSYNSRKPIIPDPYKIAEVQQRVQALDSYVPPDALLGYVSDAAPDAATVFALQYALAPRLLVQDDQPHRFVLGNFSVPTDYAEFGRQRGLLVVKEFPRGLVLYQRMKP
jgi:hypothetical protein